MARKEKKKPKGASNMWLVTFSDLMTLLLTFFVLLLTMASMDSSTIAKISPFTASHGIMNTGSRGKMPENIKFLIDALEDPDLLYSKEDTIKEYLFPNEVIPKDMDRGTFDNNVEILKHEKGWIISLSSEIVFPEGGYELPTETRDLLTFFTSLILNQGCDVNISGHTGIEQETYEMSNYALSGYRAMNVARFFIEQGIPAARFSISSYGSDKPLYENLSPEEMTKNRRVEIFLKTSPRGFTK